MCNILNLFMEDVNTKPKRFTFESPADCTENKISSYFQRNSDFVLIMLSFLKKKYKKMYTVCRLEGGSGINDVNVKYH